MITKIKSRTKHDELMVKNKSTEAKHVGACGQVDRALDLRSEGLAFDSHCWSCVEVSGKLLVPYCLCPPSSNGYQVELK